MNEIISALIKQWPALTGLMVIAFAFWTLFKKYLEENKTLLEGVRSLSTDHRSSIDQVLERYRLLSDDQVAEIARLRTLVTSLVDENEKIGKRYDDIKSEFSKVSIENRGLKRAIENVEEMLRATGGDVKVISTQLQKAQKDIDDVTRLLEHKPE
jgi:chromosome segregation ATPase